MAGRRIYSQLFFASLYFCSGRRVSIWLYIVNFNFIFSIGQRFRALQRLIFPEGIVYNKEKDRVRTTRVNSFFEPIPQLVSFLNGNEKSHPFKNGSNSLLVAPTGIEPVSKV